MMCVREEPRVARACTLALSHPYQRMLQRRPPARCCAAGGAGGSGWGRRPCQRTPPTGNAGRTWSCRICRSWSLSSATLRLMSSRLAWTAEALAGAGWPGGPEESTAPRVFPPETWGVPRSRVITHKLQLNTVLTLPFSMQIGIYPIVILEGLPGGSVVRNMPAMQVTWVQSLSWEDGLGKEMATHSSIFAWEIPWSEEPGRLQSTGSQESDMT